VADTSEGWSLEGEPDADAPMRRCATIAQPLRTASLPRHCPKTRTRPVCMYFHKSSSLELADNSLLMRLLQLKDDGEFTLTEFIGKNIPPYAVLSHTWGLNSEEVSLKDLIDGTGKSKSGYKKIHFCGKQAANDGFQYIWVDTCCVDKSSSADLTEAINSMFRWYQDAAKCYVHLSDVSIDGSVWDKKKAFEHSRWFTRGWTLQELLAPASVDFFSLEGERLGDKSSLVQEIHKITGISVQALQGAPLSQFSVEERMSWAATRNTTRGEDAAYSMLGIFDISMPLIYGEGWKKATHRLQKKIMKSLTDGMTPAISLTYQESSLIPLSNMPVHHDTIPSLNAEASNSDTDSMSFLHADEEITWHGQIRWKPGQNKDSPYIRARDELCNASKDGDWEDVIALLERRKEVSGEIWANCWRIGISLMLNLCTANR